LEDRKGLRLRKIGRPERASAQEDWKTGKGFGSERSKRLEEASATEDRRNGKRELEGPIRRKGRKPGKPATKAGASQRSRKAERCHSLASIKKGGNRRPVSGGQQQRAENRVELERPRRICSPPSAEFRYFYGEEAQVSSL